MVHYKLVYFDSRGLFEGARLLLHFVGQEFEDVRLSRDEFLKLKPSLKYGQLPYMEVDGKRLYQSTTICRYLAEKFGLAGKDEWEKAQVNEIVDFHKDFYAKLAPYIYCVLGFFEGNKEEQRKKVYEVHAPTQLSIYEKLLKESGSGFLVASGPTFVDFVVVDLLDNWTKTAEPAILGDHPVLAEYVKRVYALPQLQKYLSTRK